MIYLDNGATSFPKAPGIGAKIAEYIETIGASVGRGHYKESFQAEMIVYETREKLMNLLGAPDTRNVIFTRNITESMNVLLFGFLKEGDHVIVSEVEHNATMRPLVELENRGITFTRVPIEPDGQVLESHLQDALQTNTKLIAMTHASNVSGALLQLGPVGAFAKANNLRFIVDAAQTAGVLPVKMADLHADAIAFTGHKSLLGPQGIGGFIITDDFADQVKPLIHGGTGSKSESEVQPNIMPDKFEAGTPNIPGIVGLHASLTYIEEEGMDKIHAKEMALTVKLMEGLKDISGVRIIGPMDPDHRTAVVSFDCLEEDNALVSHTLASTYDIRNRCGLHCAPNTHKFYGTYPQGSVRLSVGYFNTEDHIEKAIEAVKTILKG